MGMLASPKRKEYSDNGPHTIPAFRRTRERSARDPMPYAISNSAFGNVLVASNPKGVASILIGDEPAALIEELQDNFPGATLRAAIAWSPHRTRGCLVPAAHTARAVRRSSKSLLECRPHLSNSTTRFGVRGGPQVTLKTGVGQRIWTRRRPCS
jgi:hypothetical protein